jgi:EmrB/QacA subfamily drug resistance transporter
MFKFIYSQKTLIPFIISLALFMEALDTTIINTAIPAISYSLKVPPVDLKFALISYLVSLAIFIPISGWVADKFGIKKVFIIALFIFTISSFWCGYTNNLTELVLARIIQGIGGSHMLRLGRLIIVRTFERHELITAMTRVVLVAALGMMLGPVLGGLITHYMSWRWIFWVNIPVGVITIILSILWLKKATPQVVPPLDKVGFILFGSGLTGLIVSLSAFTESTISGLSSLGYLCASVALMLLYLWHSRNVAHPIIKPAIFRFRTFSISLVGNLTSRLGFGGVPFLLPLLLQISFGYSAQLSGLLLAPIALGVWLVKPFSLWLLRAIGYKKLLIINTNSVAIILCAFSFLTIHTTLPCIALLTFLFGFLISLQYSAMNSLGYAQLPADQLSSATSVMSTAQQLAQSFGVSVGAILLNYFSTREYHSIQLNVSIFHHTFLSMGILTSITSLIFLRLKRTDGNELIVLPTSLPLEKI